MADINKKDFLLNELPKILGNLSAETEGSFGLMTPQHMVEHIIKVFKSTAAKYEGERELPANKRQLRFQQFVKSGTALSYRPSDKTKADLPTLKYNSLEEAIAAVPEAAQRFYSFWDNNPGFVPYAPFMGELSFEYLELFHYMHFRFHLWQFRLIEEYP